MFKFKGSKDQNYIPSYQPFKATNHSAAFDVYANEDTILFPFEPKWVPTGLWIASKAYDDSLEEYYLRIAARSSFFLKGIYTHPGTIDADFPDEIKIGLQWNPFKGHGYPPNGGFMPEFFEITKGERIAQMFCEQTFPLVGGIISETKRTGGYGSTNKK